VNESLENLNAAINLAGGGVYAPSTPANADCSSYIRNPGQLEADALVAGAAGNAITVTSSHEAVAFWYGEGAIPRGTLQLGADATGVAGWTQGYILEDGGVARTLGTGPGQATYMWDVTDGRGTVSVDLGSALAEGTILELKYLAVFPFHAIVSSGSPPRTTLMRTSTATRRGPGPAPCSTAWASRRPTSSGASPSSPAAGACASTSRAR